VEGDSFVVASGVCVCVVGNLLFSGMVIRREDLNLKSASG
jgi:hypothetical protein